MATGEQKDCKHALKRVEDSLVNLDKSKSLSDVKQIHRDLQPAINALFSAKINLLWSSPEPEPESKRKLKMRDEWVRVLVLFGLVLMANGCACCRTQSDEVMSNEVYDTMSAQEESIRAYQEKQRRLFPSW